MLSERVADRSCLSFALFSRIVVRLRRRSAPPDARDTILLLSAAERVSFPCDAHRRNRIVKNPRLILFLLL